MKLSIYPKKKIGKSRKYLKNTENKNSKKKPKIMKNCMVWFWYPVFMEPKLIIRKTESTEYYGFNFSIDL